MQLLQTLGKFHLLVLHLPIGFLVLAFLMEMAARRSMPALRPAIGFALFWGMLSAVASAGMGYVLSLEGGYEEELLSLHQWLGFATAGLAVLLYFLQKSQAASKAYLPVFLVTVAALAAAGHFGGSLTHGEGFLLENKKDAAAAAAPIANLDSAQVFADLVLPLLKDKCAGCHNPAKRKGDLILTTKDGILAGGESGPAFNAANPAESPMLVGLHLPLEDEKHMPPKGKKQLSAQELQLLDWWLQSGAPFDKTVAASAMPAEVRAGLVARAEHKAGPLDGLDLAPVSDAKLRKLREQGVPVYPLSDGSPFLQALYAGRKDLDLKTLQLLKPVAANIVQLNLSRTNTDDAMLAVVKDMPHLNRLHLDQTAVTDQGMALLSNLQLLEYLNLYGTKVTDAGLQALQALPMLRSVYLWQTAATEQGIARFVAAKPGVFLQKGIENDSIFGEVSLKPPVLKASKELFTDTLQVMLESGFGNAKVHFTLDGSEPDSNSPVYTKPILLQNSAQVKAFARKDGWSPSSAVSRNFVKVRYKPTNITLAIPPNPKYAGEGGKTLVDFVKGVQNFKSGEWLGFEGDNLVATIDLGQVSEVSKVSFGTLEDVGGWIFFPKGLRVSSSVDGQHFKKEKQAEYPVAGMVTQPSNKFVTESFKPTKARYVKVEVLSVGKNPAWHPGAGKKCWVFVDEILVE